MPIRNGKAEGEQVTLDNVVREETVYTISTISVSTILGNTANMVLVTATAGPITVTLPSAGAAGIGHVVRVKDQDGTSTTKPITVAAAGVETIDGEASVQLALAHGSLEFVSNGVSWVQS